ncbi:MAG: tetratricopeptide repeat protein [Pseudomonadota bacterium]
MQPKVMQLLLCLVDNHGQVVSSEYLLEHVWPDVFVDGGALRRAIYFLRKALSTDNNDAVIETLSKRGYRLNLAPSKADASPVEVSETSLTTTAAVTSAYRGLNVFDIDHAQQFFGRAALTTLACDALARQLDDGRAFVLLLGASGSGKSSLARAGVLPALVEERRRQGLNPDVFVLEAGKGLKDPVFQIAESLLRTFGVTRPLNPDVMAFIERLSEDAEETIAQLIEQDQEEDSPVCRAIWLLDQFEQFLTSATLADEQRTMIFSVIYSLARSGAVHIVATMRNEFYPQLIHHDALRYLKGRHGIVDVTQPGAAEIGDIVRKPAVLAGLAFEQREDKQRLDVRLIDEATTLSNSLPLLQFALRELELSCGESKLLSFAQYDKLGSLKGCLSQHAERVYQSLSDEQQRCLAQVLSQLVTADPRNASRLLKRTVPLSEFRSAPARALIERFVNARLMISFLDAYTNEPSIEIIHESVMEHWQRARDWAERSYADLRFRSWLTELSDKWRQDDHAEAYLLRDGKLLVDAQKLLGREGFFDENQQRFVRASLKRADRASHIRRGVIASLAALLGVSLILWNQAIRNADKAERALGRANITSSFMASIFSDAEPGTQGEVLTALDVVTSARDRLRDEPIDDPLAQADSLRTLGELFLKLNDYEQAGAMFEQAQAVYQQADEDAPLLEAQIALELAGLQREIGEIERAREYANQALAAAERADDRFLVARIQNMLGLVKQGEDDFERAGRWFTQALDTLLPVYEQSERNARLLSRIHNNIGLNYLLARDYDSAVAPFEHSLSLLAERGRQNSADYNITMNNLGMLRRRQGEHEASAKIFSEAIETRLRYHPLSHPDVIALHTNLASAYMSLGDYAQVLNTVQRALSADLTGNAYDTTAIPQLRVRRVSAQQLGGLPSSGQDVREAREAIEVLERELRPGSSTVLESKMAVNAAVWQLGGLLDDALDKQCQETRDLVAEQRERQSRNPRVVELEQTIAGQLIRCAVAGGG